ncbi:tetratricopeptide (TPR) repeat protein [Brevundimonas alba]|uniref:Tetratricopeptide (TPR) repeat protein n=1 Tax=Brevundimonas alba TaxID=74314 RepID=A0A7X5YJH2_9CAUL|nr:hypothetical protein [Brevundimonas alba]NJC41085.1 tetratricopeptide (TPR) repeat protein [Brevundimonas alba]
MSIGWVRLSTGLSIAAFLAMAPAAYGQMPPQDGTTITLGGQGRLSRAESEDLAVYEAAMRDFECRGFAGLEANRTKLMRSLDRAPATYPVVERTRDRIIVRVADQADALMMSLMAGAMGGADDGRPRQVVTQANVYPMIALVLGSAAVERQDYEGAIVLLDRGLALQPLDRLLLAERITALHGLGKWEEGLRAADEALASQDLLIASHAAMFHRKRGFSLVELGRLDEAQAAYEESLTTEPDNAAALREIAYIAELRQGAKPTEAQFIAPGAAPSAQ